MATYKIVVLKDNARQNNTLPIYIRLTHERNVAYIKLPYTALPNEVDRKGCIKDSYLLRKVNPVHDKVGALLDEIGMGIGQFTVKTLKSYLERKLFMAPEGQGGLDFFVFAKKYIATMQADGRTKSAKNYRLTVNNLAKFLRRQSGFGFNEITANFCAKYNAWQKQVGLGARGQELYLGCLRKMFNDAVREYNDYDTDETPIRVQPFSRFKVPTPPLANNAEKRALPVEVIRQIFAYQPATMVEELAKDIYMLSFCLCGLNAADFYTCTKTIDSDDGSIILLYDRAKSRWRKGGAKMQITIPQEVVHLFEKYKNVGGGKEVFCFVKRYVDTDGFSVAINRGLKRIWQSKSIKVDAKIKADFEKLTLYTARHSWATIATNDLDIPDERVDDCLAHAPVRKMLRKYVKKDWSKIDSVNRKVLDYVFENFTS